MTYADGAEFAIDSTASEIFGIAGRELPPEDLFVYLQGPVLGFTLRLRGITCLHGSAAVAEDGAFAVIGRGGMGKSTTAAFFARQGLEVLTDDVLALADRGHSFEVQPGLPRVLLWPQSVAALFGDQEALPRIVGSWDKRYLDLNKSGYRFAQGPSKLRVIYVLGDRLEKGSAPEIAELKGTAALMGLVANTYANKYLAPSLRARELEALGRLVGQVPVRSVRAPADSAALDELGEAILADVRALR